MRVSLQTLIEQLYHEVQAAWSADVERTGPTLDWHTLGRMLTRASLAQSLTTIREVLRNAHEDRGIVIEVSVPLESMENDGLVVTARLAPAMDPALGMSADTLKMGWPRPAAAQAAADPPLPELN